MSEAKVVKRKRSNSLDTVGDAYETFSKQLESITKELSRKEKDLAAREDGIEKREKELKKTAKEQEDQAKQLEKREKSCVSKEKKCKMTEATLVKQEKELVEREQALQKQEQKLRKQQQQSLAKLPDVNHLNVSGTRFLVEKQMLLKHEGSLFEQLLCGKQGQSTSDTEIQITRDPELFKYILRFLLHGHLVTLPATFGEAQLLCQEFEYFGIPIPDDLQNAYCDPTFPVCEMSAPPRFEPLFEPMYDFVAQTLSSKEAGGAVGMFVWPNSEPNDFPRMTKFRDGLQIDANALYRTTSRNFKEIAKDLQLYTEGMRNKEAARTLMGPYQKMPIAIFTEGHVPRPFWKVIKKWIKLKKIIVVAMGNEEECKTVQQFLQVKVFVVKV